MKKFLVDANLPSKIAKIIHIKIGNMKLKDFNSTIGNLWSKAKLSKKHKLVNVFADRIEAVE